MKRLIRKIKTYIRDLYKISTAEVIEIWRTDTSNQGDLCCAPFLYFSSSKKSLRYDIMKWPSYVTPKNKCIVVGGGGLFQAYFSEQMEKILALAKNNKVVIWGVGVDNYIGATPVIPELKLCYRVGLRDYYNNNYGYLPCASCMSELFDEFRNSPIRYRVKLYLHDDYSGLIANDLHDIPVSSNHKATSYREIIEFLSDAEVVLTNSYHGMYWATLLNKKVIVLPWITKDKKIGFSEKFKNFKYKPVFCTDYLHYERYIDSCTCYESALEECRQINRDFYESIKNVVN